MSACHAPQPATRTPTTREVCAALEVPWDCGCDWRPVPCGCAGPCDCPVALPPACPHVRARAHSLALDRWAQFLTLAFAGDPDGYGEPPPPPRHSEVLTKQERVEVYAERHAAGRGLYHPRDIWRPSNIVRYRAAVAAGRLRNGAVDPDETLAGGAPPPPPAPSLTEAAP